MADYQTSRIRRESFKMNVTEAMRAHCQLHQDIAAKMYEAAATLADGNYADFRESLFYLFSQTNGQSARTFGQVVRNAMQCGYEPQLRNFVELIEDPQVSASLEECIKAAKDQRKANTGKFQRPLADSPSGRHKLH